jgi:hypothetical protein
MAGFGLDIDFRTIVCRLYISLTYSHVIEPMSNGILGIFPD